MSILNVTRSGKFSSDRAVRSMPAPTRLTSRRSAGRSGFFDKLSDSFA